MNFTFKEDFHHFIFKLLRYVGQSSPECLVYPDQQLNVPAPVPSVLDSSIQGSAVTSVLKQHNEEENYIHEISQDARYILIKPSIESKKFYLIFIVT